MSFTNEQIVEVSKNQPILNPYNIVLLMFKTAGIKQFVDIEHRFEFNTDGYEEAVFDLMPILSKPYSDIVKLNEYNIPESIKEFCEDFGSYSWDVSESLGITCIKSEPYYDGSRIEDTYLVETPDFSFLFRQVGWYSSWDSSTYEGIEQVFGKEIKVIQFTSEVQF